MLQILSWKLKQQYRQNDLFKEPALPCNLNGLVDFLHRSNNLCWLCKHFNNIPWIICIIEYIISITTYTPNLRMVGMYYV